MKSTLFITLILIVSINSTLACDCEPWYENVEEWFFSAPIAIEGEIKSSKYIGQDDTVKTVNEKGDTIITINIDENGYDLYEVKVLMNFKDEKIDSTIQVKSESNSSCSFHFKVNNKYIIFASDFHQGIYYTDVCYGSRLSNKHDIEAIEKIIKKK